MEKIKKWLVNHNKSQMWLANKLKITDSRLSRILSGELNIKLHEALELKKITRGNIQPQDLIPTEKETKNEN